MGNLLLFPMPYPFRVDIWDVLSKMVSWASNFGASRDFFIQVLTFEGIILTIAVPLSLDMVSRVSERYQSSVVTRRFRSKYPVIFLPSVLLFKVTALIITLFFAPETSLVGAWKALSWLTLASFLAVVFLIIGYYRVLHRYMSEESSQIILQDLFNNASKALQKY